MVYDRETAARRAETARTNVPDACQAWTRGIFGANAVGDVDGDGAADAEDGWKSEPASARHTDRNPPRGTPVAYSGGSKDNGHRAVSIGNGKIRTTDGAGRGVVATRPLNWPETEWGLKYLGWSNTISGKPIPPPREEQPRVVTPTTFGIDVSHYQLKDPAVPLKLSTLKKQGYQFVILKCTQGTGSVDSSYPKGLVDAKAAGLLVAAYHFLEHGDTLKQAKNLAAHVVDKTVPVFIDVEPTGGSRPTASDWISFRNECTKLGLLVVGKYLTSNYWAEINKPSLKGPLVLWRAAYPSSKHDYGSSLYPGNSHERWDAFGGQTPTLWQFASSARLDGYSGNVDVNAFRGSVDNLRALKIFKDFSKPVVVTPTPAPTPPPVVIAPDPAKPFKDFRIHLVPGNKTQSVKSVMSDMSIVRKKTFGGSAVVFNTERELDTQRSAVSAGLGTGWTRVLDNENTVAYGSSWTAAEPARALKLAKQDPYRHLVSPTRWLDTVPLENSGLTGVVINFKGLHLLSEANCIHKNVLDRAWREKMWPVQLADVLNDVQIDHDAGRPVVLVGDFNTGVYFRGAKVYAMLQERFGKDMVAWVHNGDLDQIFLISTPTVKLSEIGFEFETDNGSDHDMITAVIRAELR